MAPLSAWWRMRRKPAVTSGLDACPESALNLAVPTICVRRFCRGSPLLLLWIATVVAACAQVPAAPQWGADTSPTAPGATATVSQHSLPPAIAPDGAAPVRALFVIHSLSERTAVFAGTLARALRGDVFRLSDAPPGSTPVPIPDAILAADLQVDTAPYDLIFLCGPIWDLGETPALRVAAERLALADKRVVVVHTLLHGYDPAADLLFRDALEARGATVVDAVFQRFPFEADVASVVRRAREVLRERAETWIEAARPSLVSPPPTSPTCEGVATLQGPATMCWVPAGVVWHGCVNADACAPEVPEAVLEAVGSFWIDEGEVTLERYTECVSQGVCPPLNPDGESQLLMGTGLPAPSVPLSGADAWCRWTGRRLPTEAEWQRAARGATTAPYPWGDEAIPVATHDRANLGESAATGHADYSTAPAGFTDGFKGLSPPCTFPAGNSPFGVCDLAGNLLEWVLITPERPTLKGGSWLEAEPYTYTVDSSTPEVLAYQRYGSYLAGFRCATDDGATGAAIARGAR